MKLYRKAPLPFVGQKRNFIKPFAALLQENIKDGGAGWTVVDVFGDYVNFIVAEQIHNWRDWAGCRCVSLTVPLNHSAKYEDNMVYKF